MKHPLITAAINIKWIKVFSLTLVLLLIVSVTYISFEPSATIAASVSQQVVVSMTVDTGISISNPGNTSMSTHLGVSSNSAVASSAFTVVTNDTLGYGLTVAASNAPAMTSASDSVPDANATPGTWAVPANSTQFGFSVYGADVDTGTYGTDTSCQSAANVPSTSLNYRGFDGATTINVAGRSSTTTPSGVATTVCYAVGQNNSFIPSGSYSATITATATSN